MSKEGDPKKVPNHNWQRTVTVRKEYVCEICNEKIEPGSKAKYRVKEDNIVVHAHVDCVKKGHGTGQEAKELEAAIQGIRDATCDECPDQKKCKKDCAVLTEALAEVGTVA